MVAIERHVACVILQDRSGKIALQLRDDIPTIICPNEWCIFGGGIEGDESPEAAAIRELQEELNIELDVDRLNPVGAFYHKPTRVFHVFHYAVDDELEQAVLGEGQDWGCFSAETILTGAINNHTVVAHHLAIINWFVNTHLPNFSL